MNDGQNADRLLLPKQNVDDSIFPPISRYL
jgi:hypothetical protein